MSSEDKVDPEKTALILIEFQNEFTTEGGKLYDAVKDCMAEKNTLGNAKDLLDSARKSGLTVVHLPISFDKGHNEISKDSYGILKGVKDGEAFLNGEWGSEFAEGFKPETGELTANGKVGLCGFQSTNLDFMMRQRGCDTLVIAGFLTNCCVESTMRSAYERGYKVFTVEDACAATSLAGHNSAYEHNFGMFSVPTDTKKAIASFSS